MTPGGLGQADGKPISFPFTWGGHTQFHTDLSEDCSLPTGYFFFCKRKCFKPAGNLHCRKRQLQWRLQYVLVRSGVQTHTHTHTRYSAFTKQKLVFTTGKHPQVILILSKNYCSFSVKCDKAPRYVTGEFFLTGVSFYLFITYSIILCHQKTPQSKKKPLKSTGVRSHTILPARIYYCYLNNYWPTNHLNSKHEGTDWCYPQSVWISQSLRNALCNIKSSSPYHCQFFASCFSECFGPSDLSWVSLLFKVFVTFWFAESKYLDGAGGEERKKKETLGSNHIVPAQMQHSIEHCSFYNTQKK